MEARQEALWSTDEVAGYLGVPVATLYQWRHRGYGPPGRRVGRHMRYLPEDVRAWFLAQAVPHRGVD